MERKVLRNIPIFKRTTFVVSWTIITTFAATTITIMATQAVSFQFLHISNSFECIVPA